jgi:NDP-sugar pyrophosphorylase family protein
MLLTVGLSFASANLKLKIFVFLIFWGLWWFGYLNNKTKKIMQAVILAAGRGKRMGDLTLHAPKPMLKIKGKPILDYKIRALPRKIDEVIFVVGYFGEEIKKYFGEEFDGRKITYVLQEVLNGTGGAIHTAKDLLKEKFLVIMGDDLYHPKDLEKMTESDLSLLAREVDDPSRFGVLRTDEKGNLLEVIEKPQGLGRSLVAVAAYVLNPKFFEYKLVPIGGGEFGLPQTLAVMAKDYPVKVEKATDWFPITSPEDLIAAEEAIDKFI